MNFDRKQRARYLDLAKAWGYETVIVVMPQVDEVFFGDSKVMPEPFYNRVITRKNHPTIKSRSVAKRVIYMFFSKYEPPELSEADQLIYLD